MTFGVNLRMIIVLLPPQDPNHGTFTTSPSRCLIVPFNIAFQIYLLEKSPEHADL